MSGYASVEEENEAFSLRLYLRTLNKKNGIELLLKAPPHYHTKEIEIRRLLQQHLYKGKCYLTIQEEIKDPNILQTFYRINATQIAALYQQLQQIAQTLKIEQPISLELLFQFPGIFLQPVLEPLEEQWQFFCAALEKCIQLLLRDREREGNAIIKVIQGIVVEIEQRLQAIQELLPQREMHIKKVLEEGIQRIEHQNTEAKTALEQALLYYLLRVDIHEEIHRFKTHLEAFKQLLPQSHKGDKLDYLAQEMLREITTLSNKSEFAPIQSHAVAIKTQIKQIREHLANLT